MTRQRVLLPLLLAAVAALAACDRAGAPKPTTDAAPAATTPAMPPASAASQ